MNREYHREYSKKYYHKRRDELIKLLGGKCVVCGTNENLEFDHVNDIKGKIDIGKLLNYSWKIILKEIEKCQLLCREHHKEKSRANGSFGKNRLVGSMSKMAKLNEDMVREIIVLLKSGEKMQLIADKFCVSYKTIANIKHGKNWKHVV